jgi:hypothetical protein
METPKTRITLAVSLWIDGDADDAIEQAAEVGEMLLINGADQWSIIDVHGDLCWKER